MPGKRSSQAHFAAQECILQKILDAPLPPFLTVLGEYFQSLTAIACHGIFTTNKFAKAVLMVIAAMILVETLENTAS